MRIKAVSSGKATGQLQHAGRQKQGWNPLLPDAKELFSLREVVLRENNCVRFGRYASLSACVLFAGGCVVRIAYECFLDCNLPEIFCFQDGEQHLPISLRFQYHLINTFVKEGSLPSLTIHLAELSQLDRSCLRLVSCNLSESQTKNGLASSSASPFFQPLIEQLFFFQSYCPQLQSIPALPEQFLQPIQHGYNDTKPRSLLHKLPAL